ncbi:hypothetical protein BgiMline_018719 [Biomphalaria glabrata]|nr:hypothetical protein BgiMline_006317 [Biomphalaria glabrata]
MCLTSSCVSPHLVRSHQNRCLTRYGVSPDVVSHQMWCLTSSCVSPHLVRSHQKRCLTRYGVSPDVVSHQMWCLTRCGVPSEEVSYQIWSHYMWCLTRCGVSPDVMFYQRYVSPELVSAKINLLNLKPNVNLNTSTKL